MLNDSPMDELEQLHTEIHSCRKCDERGIQVIHPKVPLKRGKQVAVMVIGISPGNTEESSGKAFSGQAGKRLMQWLCEGGIGANEEEIRDRCYLTAVVKCGSTSSVLKKAMRICSPFLDRQFQIINPKIVITLGDIPLTAIFGATRKLESYVGRTFSEEEIQGSLLFRRLSPEARIIPLPHPSGQNNGWVTKYSKLVESALQHLKRLSQTELKGNK
jgi:uracil-DNA glycosylase family 4